MKKAGINLEVWEVGKNAGLIQATYKDWGLSDNERQRLDGYQVNAKRLADKEAIFEVAALFPGQVKINNSQVIIR